MHNGGPFRQRGDFASRRPVRNDPGFGGAAASPRLGFSGHEKAPQLCPLYRSNTRKIYARSLHNPPRMANRPSRTLLQKLDGRIV